MGPPLYSPLSWQGCLASGGLGAEEKALVVQWAGEQSLKVGGSQRMGSVQMQLGPSDRS